VGGKTPLLRKPFHPHFCETQSLFFLFLKETEEEKEEDFDFYG
jgi:hypothetical protein